MVTEYLLDVQPGLYRVLATDDGSNVNRFLHDRTGIHAQKDSSGNWDWMLKDGLGSVREVVDDNLSSLYTAQYAPYGEVWDTTGTEQTIFGYTGEPTDANGLVHLRARYYDPTLAVFNSLDPVETANRYAYVGGNPVNMTDPTGNSPACSLGGSGGFNTAQLIASAIPSHTLNAVLADGVPGVGRDGNQQGGTPTPPAPATQQQILESTVVIVTGLYDTSNVYPLCIQANDPSQVNPPGMDCSATSIGNTGTQASLGTLTDFGVLSHDHFGVPPVIGSSIQETISKLENGYDWIEFRGSDDTCHIPLNSQNPIKIGSAPDATSLSIHPDSKYFHEATLFVLPTDCPRIGSGSAQVARLGDISSLTQGDSLYFAARINRDDRNSPHTSLVVQSTPFAALGITEGRNVIRITRTSGVTLSGGDSGTGFFVLDPNSTDLLLVGIFQGEFVGNPNLLEGSYATFDR